jgi:hypothetical protein
MAAVGCNAPDTDASAPPEESKAAGIENAQGTGQEASQQVLSESEQYVMGLAAGAMRLIKEKDWEGLSALAHPEEGLTFAPYGYVDRATAVHFTPEEVKALGNDESVRVWGTYDGSGEPIQKSFADYYSEFVYSKDFAAAPQTAVDKIVKSNAEANYFVFGNGAAFAEFHFPGTELAEGMDWESLRLVFSPYEGGLMLSAVVHDQQLI